MHAGNWAAGALFSALPAGMAPVAVATMAGAKDRLWVAVHRIGTAGLKAARVSACLPTTRPSPPLPQDGGLAIRDAAPQCTQTIVDIRKLVEAARSKGQPPVVRAPWGTDVSMCKVGHAPHAAWWELFSGLRASSARALAGHNGQAGRAAAAKRILLSHQGGGSAWLLPLCRVSAVQVNNVRDFNEEDYMVRVFTVLLLVFR